MRMVDIIEKKKHKKELSTSELKFWIKGAVDGTIPDYQSSSLLMAIYFNGLSSPELGDLTRIMLESGDIISLDNVKGPILDKHSTGGVGDTTTLVLAPIIAACGGKMAKMSGKALGFTGGTIDKFESIPGFKCQLDNDRFIEQVNNIGCSVIGTTSNLVPADKVLYALRDITGTVDSIPLIASSIMSKKLAIQSDVLVLEVTYGSGAFMKNIEDAKLLGQTMVNIGKMHNRKTIAIITSMKEPLGYAVGNILEVKEAISALKGQGPKDLMELCRKSAAILLTQSKLFPTEEDAIRKVDEVINNGEAFNKFVELVKAQGGNVENILHPQTFNKSKNIIEVRSDHAGYISNIDSLTIGNVAMKLGAGRLTKNDVIDMTSGVVLAVKVGSKVEVGDLLFTIHTNKDSYFEYIKEAYGAFKFSKKPTKEIEVINSICY